MGAWKSVLLIWGLVGFAAGLGAAPADGADRRIKVGIYENPPKVFLDASNTPSGFFPQLLDAVAAKEKWRLEYVPCAWSDCLARIEDGTLDLMMDVAYSDERAGRFDFNREVVLANWSVLYIRKGGDIRSVMDVDKRRVAVVRDSIQYNVFRERAHAFGVTPTFVETDTFRQVFQDLHHGTVDAGVVNRLYGAEFETEYDVERTNILINPSNLHFAVPTNKNRDIRDALDWHLAHMKADQASEYYQAVQRWITPLEQRGMPDWVPWVLVALGVAVAIGLLFLAMLKKQVALKEEAESAARRAKENAELGTKAKSEFLANMSHELRTPLNAVIGFADMMREETYGPIGSQKYREYVRCIHDSGALLLALINDILDLSAIEAGKLDLHDGPVDLREVMEYAETLVRMKANGKKLDLTVASAENLPLLRGDERRLRQIVINLLNNAVKYTPAGGRVDARFELSSDGRIVLTVFDTGTGMTKEEIDVATMPFRQTSSAHVQKEEGSGLGLPLAKDLAELHGGILEIDSEPGAGTTVTVAFPAERVVAEARAVGR